MRGGVLSVPTLVAAFAGAAAAQEDGSSREWNQPRGNAARTGCIDVAPIQATPDVAWRLDLPGAATSSPVSWNGVVFVAAKSAKGEITLCAVRATTGELIVARNLGKADWADVAVLRNNVVVVNPEMAKCLRFDGKQFSIGWSMKGAWTGQPAIVRGTAVLADDASIHFLDPSSGREVVPPAASNIGGGFAATCAIETGPTVEVGRLQSTSWIESFVVGGLGTRTATLLPSHALVESPYTAVDAAKSPESRNAVLVRLGRNWFATYLRGFVVRNGGEAAKSLDSILLDGTGSGWQLPVGRPCAVVDGTAYAMSLDGGTYAVESDARYWLLTQPGKLPKGAAVASASASRGVVYFGNWALEIASGRVLWCLADVQPVTPLVPVGDKRGVVVDARNQLLGIAEPGAPTSSPTTADAPVAADDLPGDADGALLADGRFVAGDASPSADGRLTLAPAQGDAQTFAAGSWVLAQRGGKAVAADEEHRVLATMEDVLDRRSAAAWEIVFRKYAEVPLVSDALRVLGAAKRDGIADDRARRLEQLLAGKRDHPNADLQRRRVGSEEVKARDAYVADVRAASAWCHARGLNGAAAALLARVLSERPKDAAVEAAARELMPSGFPDAATPSAGERWIAWARQIVPAGGSFVAADAPEAKAARAPPWDEEVILLRTRNVLLVSRSRDPAVVGACLRHAEGAIRACERVLGPASKSAAATLMEVRLHRDRKEYLAEVTPSGGRAREWTAGYYSPMERVSRFYVPGEVETEATTLERTLLSVLAHEVTHQWIDLRWAPGGGSGPKSCGYWCVEGVARFIEDQSVEMGRREGRLDDATVESLDATSQIDAASLFSLARLIAMSHADFEALGDAPQVKVSMRNTARFLLLDPRGLFYQQSGSLVFWLVNRRGDAGRAAFADYLRRRYRGQAPADAAPTLGFASAGEMEAEFRKFLAGLRQ